MAGRKIAPIVKFESWRNHSYTKHGIVIIKILNTFRSLIGLVLAVLGTLSGWGFVMYLDIRWQSTNLASLFLLLGVGMDDTFVMLNSWKRIKAIRPEESVEEKIQETYRVITK